MANGTDRKAIDQGVRMCPCCTGRGTTAQWNHGVIERIPCQTCNGRGDIDVR